MQTSTEQLTRCSTGTLAEEVTKDNASTRTISEKIMNICRKAVRLTILLDIFFVLSVTVIFAVLEFGSLPFDTMGFFCNDPKISFKFTGDTITLSILLFYSLAVPLIVMYVTEYTCYSIDSYKSLLSSGGSRSKQIWNWYGYCAITTITLTFICEVMKILIGEPRPHFLDTCRPREAANCTNEYVNSYTCTNTEYSEWFIVDASRSFPSGHAAISVCISVFIVWYLQNRLPDRTLFLKPWLQCLMSLWAVICSLTRITDNRHHWWDVLVGVMLGLLFGMYVVVISCRNFRIGHTSQVVSHVVNETTESGQISFVEK